jgi:formylglycine-generating enzyme required for sulfatase activity
MSQTLITQAQWRAIARLPKEAIELKLEPSNSPGDDLPVESVKWKETLEFCARLSRYTGINYRLPSEAEWEYGCRAGTTTPFHFGETLTGKLANYRASETYQEEVAVEGKRTTTPVRSFKPNSYGLYDMHGNVFEWCLDPWHNNYKGAPEDGSIWDQDNHDNFYQDILNSIQILIKDKRTHVLRGGSWILKPSGCRSAYRGIEEAGLIFLSDVGFRVVCVPQDS